MNQPADTAAMDVRYVADLARLELTDDEARRYGDQLQAVLAYVAQLRELDVAGVEPTAHATRLVNVLRDDAPAASLPRERLLANAPATAGEQFIRVPAVIAEET